jgi:hypothetical protein
LNGVPNKALCELAITSLFLADLVALYWVTCRCYLLGSLADEKIIDGKDFIKKLELEFGLPLLLRIKLNTIQLHRKGALSKNHVGHLPA